MKYLLPIFGAHIQFAFDIEKRNLIIYREYSKINFDLELGMELRGGRTCYLLGRQGQQEGFDRCTQETGPGYIRMLGYDSVSGLKLSCTISNTFDPGNEKQSCAPGVLFECKAERIRKDPDNAAGNLFFRIRPRRGEVDVESAMRLMVGYYVGGAAYNPNHNPVDQNQYEMVRVRDHILPTRGKIKGKAVKQPFFFQYGSQVDTMRFIWCMYDPMERYRIQQGPSQYFYTYYFKNIFQVEEYMVKHEWALRKKRDTAEQKFQIPFGGNTSNEILAYAHNSFIGSVGYYLESGKYKRILLAMRQDGCYSNFHMQLYTLPFYQLCWPQLFRDVVLEWREFHYKWRAGGREIYAFPDQMGRDYEVQDQIPEIVNVANSIWFILFLYAVYKMEQDENILWLNRDFLHQVFGFIFLDFRELQYTDLFISVNRMEISEFLPFTVMARLKMALKIIRELVFLLELQKKDGNYLPKLDELERELTQKMAYAYQLIPQQLPYYDISDMVYYQMMFCNENVWKADVALDYIRRGAKNHYCPHGKGTCRLDEVRNMQYCPYSRQERDICVEHLLLRDLLLTYCGMDCFGKLPDYAKWVAAEKKPRENGFPTPILSAASGYLFLYHKKKWRNEPE